MLVVAGLGNPGASYAGNRHNIGFMAADAIARRHSFSPWRNKFKSLIAEGEICRRKGAAHQAADLHEPIGRGGRARPCVSTSFEPSDLIVLYDELDLPPGKLRVKTGGGAGGHNGIRSIDSHCGNDYRRVRLGIGHPGHKDLVQRHVLGDFAKADAQWLEPLLDAVAEQFPAAGEGR